MSPNMKHGGRATIACPRCFILGDCPDIPEVIMRAVPLSRYSQEGDVEYIPPVIKVKM